MGATRREPFGARAASLGALAVLLMGPVSGAAATRGTEDRMRTGAPLTARLIASPAAPGSAEPNLATGPDGRVWLSWIEPAPAPVGARGGARRASDVWPRLRCAALRGGRWSPPSTIAAGESLFVNWADFPGVTPRPDGRLAAYWLWTLGPDPYAYEVRLSESRDGGSSWSPPARAHADASNAEHGFVSMAHAGGDVRLAWLDGRKGAGKPEGAAEMELRAARLDAGGAVVDERLLDPRVCDCCQTAAVAVPGGMLVAYRDRSPAEVRDISLVRLERGRWGKPYPLHADRWTIAGCPVNGPSLAASGTRVVAAWFTGASDAPRVMASFSDDGGAHFGAPRQVDGDGPLGRVQVMMLDDGSALVLWLGSTPSPNAAGRDGLVLARRVTVDGALGVPVTIARTMSARASGFPRMARAAEAVVFAWTEAEPARGAGAKPAPKRIRVATLDVRALGGAAPE